MDWAWWATFGVLGAEAGLRVGLSVRVLLRRESTGATLSWLALIMLFPLVGAGLYLLVGESRLGRRRAAREREVHPAYARYLDDLTARSGGAGLDGEGARLAREVRAALGVPAQTGNAVELLGSAEEFGRALEADIRGAQRSCHLEFFIWESAGWVSGVEDALMDAARRGVVCRVLVDSIGSAAFLRGGRARALRASGVKIVEALPAGVLSTLVRRVDLRNHRKVVVVDGEVGYTGSANLVDPAHFKRRAGVGRWVDAMARVRGPSVEVLMLVFVRDWELETGSGLEALASHGEFVGSAGARVGGVTAQVAPSGPGLGAGAIHSVMVSAIYAAERELALTTPYFVPDEAIRTALCAAARRGVRVTLILPARVDSALVGFAGRAFYTDLLASGVRIVLFRSGLLHTKSMVIDGRIGVLGTVNMDPRSFWLNFEITMVVYNEGFASELAALLRRYESGAEVVELGAWVTRSWTRRLTENVAQLFSPLL